MAGNSIPKQTKKTVESKTSPFNANQKKLKFILYSIMKKIVPFFIIALFLSDTVFAQIKFSDETKKYIEYNDSITVLKNALLIDGKGNAAKPHQTIIISNGKVIWIGDDAKANTP